jgi:hypothetical protein
MRKAIQITISYDDIFWRQEDSRRVGLDACEALREIAKYHRAKVDISERDTEQEPEQ